MEWTAVNSAAAGTTDYNWDAGSPAITALCRKIGYLIEGARDEIRKLHFGDRAHAHQGSSDRCTDDGRLRYRRIDNTQLAEFLQHACRDFKSAAIYAHVFAQNEHALVRFHLFPDTLFDCFDIRCERHS